MVRVRLAGRGADASMVPWIWGVNGLASVLGGLLTALGSKLIGFQAVVLIGAAMYLVAAACARQLREPDSADDDSGVQAGRPAAEPTASRS